MTAHWERGRLARNSQTQLRFNDATRELGSEQTLGIGGRDDGREGVRFMPLQKKYYRNRNCRFAVHASAT